MEIIELTYRQPCRLKITMPVLKGKVYKPLYAVGVQPLLGQTGLVYYLRHRYANNKGNKNGK